jgi:hypothetical protein
MAKLGLMDSRAPGIVLGSKRSSSWVSMATVRTNIALPGAIRSKKAKPLATEASQQAAHSIARAREHHQKNFPHWRHSPPIALGRIQKRCPKDSSLLGPNFCHRFENEHELCLRTPA